MKSNVYSKHLDANYRIQMKDEQHIKHTLKRLAERFDFAASRTDYDNIISLIQSNKARFIARTSPSQKFFKVPYMDKQIAVLYNKRHKSIITVMPVEWVVNKYGNIQHSQINGVG